MSKLKHTNKIKWIVLQPLIGGMPLGFENSFETSCRLGMKPLGLACVVEEQKKPF